MSSTLCLPRRRARRGEPPPSVWFPPAGAGWLVALRDAGLASFPPKREAVSTPCRRRAGRVKRSRRREQLHKRREGGEESSRTTGARKRRGRRGQRLGRRARRRQRGRVALLFFCAVGRASVGLPPLAGGGGGSGATAGAQRAEPGGRARRITARGSGLS